MKKKILSAVLTGAMCASMVIPAMANTAGGAVPTLDGTEVWAGITLDDPDAKIKVEVPTLFAFVVNGSVDAGATGAVESAITNPGGTADILLPNIKVKVDSASTAAGNDGIYHLETVASGNWKFVNYSTKAGNQVEGRAGLEVQITGSIKNEGTEASRNYWTHVANADDAVNKGETAGFKKYTLEVNQEKFDQVESDGSFVMSNPITLGAPDLTVGGVNKTTGYANVGREVETAFNVHVGGKKNQYNQVEESAKVGTIVWTIQAESQDGVETAPDNDFLPGNPTP